MSEPDKVRQAKRRYIRGLEKALRVKLPRDRAIEIADRWFENYRNKVSGNVRQASDTL